MSYEGILVNALVTLFAAACYGFVAVELWRKRAATRQGSRAAIAFFGVVGVYLLIAAARQATAYAGTLNASYAFLDAWLYHVVVIPAAFTIVPMAYVTSFALWGRESLSRWLALGFTCIAVVGLFFLYWEGVSGPMLSYWGSDWTINSLVTQVLLLLFLTLPAVCASVMLVYNGSKMPGAGGRRLRLVGWSFLIYYVAFTLDAFGLEGVAFIAVRFATAAAALIGYWAYADTGDAPSAAAHPTP